MQILLNGENVQTTDGISISGLLIQLGIGHERVAVEVNRAIVVKAKYDSQILADGDSIEVVHFVGGG